MSGTILWIASIDRYISIVNHKYYKLCKIPKFHLIFWGRNFVGTQKIYGQHLMHWLEQNMTLTILKSLYCNVCLHRNITKSCCCFECSFTKTLSIQQPFKSKLSKTIEIIVGIMVACHTPLMITLNIAAYAFTDSPRKFI